MTARDYLAASLADVALSRAGLYAARESQFLLLRSLFLALAVALIMSYDVQQYPL